MNALETFFAVFIGTFMAQISVLIFDRYIKKHLNKGADKLDEHIQNRFIKNRFRR